MILRPYQQRAVESIRGALARSRSVCLALQVGGGKTVIACEIIRLVLARQRRALFVVHRIELVEQARDRLAAFGIDAGIIKAGFVEQRDLPVQVACVPSLVRREFPPADLVILDEAHHGVSASWLEVVQHYRQAGSWLLGITATPQRLDGKPLGDAFDAIVEPVTTRELIDGGYLLDPTVYAPPSIDRRGLHKRGGDFSLPEIAERMAKLTGSITDYWSRYCRGRRTLCFAVNIAHSHAIEAALRDHGALVEHVDGTTPAAARAATRARLQAGEIDVVTQCQLWTEGLDIPELSGLIVARPTASLGLHRQMLGRVMRPATGKVDALVLDHAGNHHAHGSITDEIEWSLEGRAKRAAAEPLTTCPLCFAVYPPGAPVCPSCGQPRPVREEVEPPAVENPGELARFEPRTARQSWYSEQVALASQRGYKLAWARLRYRDRYGTWPRHRDVERREYHCRAHKYALCTSGAWREVRCEVCYEARPT